MKRISLLVVLMVLWANVAFAANWEWSGSSDEIGYFFDTIGVHYGKKFNGKPDYNVIHFWEKRIYDQSYISKNFQPGEKLSALSYSIHRCSINFEDKTVTHYEDFLYDKFGNLLRELKRKPEAMTIVPDSYGEKLFWDVFFYALMNR